MRRILLVTTLLTAGCGTGGDARTTAAPTATEGSPATIEAPAPPGTEAGRLVATQAGCLACHRIGESGNDGPGPDLTRVGARLSREDLRRVLVDPQPPMPSYARLEAASRDALLDYLTALR